ncbi:MAG: magnesium transporter [Planctomycetes bacterium]|nr:magnesium transporter [Planctomycetota bacterium]
MSDASNDETPNQVVAVESPFGERLPAADLQDAWRLLDTAERVDGFRLLAPAEGHEFFLALAAADQMDLILGLPSNERRLWMRLLAPDDAADVIQAADEGRRGELVALLDDMSKREVSSLLAYAEDDAGGLMSPRFARVRPEMSVDEAITYMRKQVNEKLETIYYGYVLDSQQRLLGVVSFRDLFSAKGAAKVSDVMKKDVVTVPETMDQEAVGRLFAQYDLMALPVCDGDGRMKGIVTFDDIVQVVQEEATEDIQKIGGSEALDAPYLQVGLGSMLKKRAGWLIVLFLGEMLTATAMGYFEHEIAAAIVLSLFIPLIISSGGNSGSQATTLVIRAMSLGEVRVRDWMQVFRRELASGLALGTILGSIGFLRVVAWHALGVDYGPHYLWLGATIGISLLGVVLWGTLSGAMLPLALRRLGFDPASASAPLVATLVDVTGLVIYFSAASALYLHHPAEG